MSEVMVVPLRDRVLLLGEERKTPLQVWCEGKFITFTRLPGGRAVLPSLEGRVQIKDEAGTHARVVLDNQLTVMVDGFALEAADDAVVNVWPIGRNDASTRRGMLSGASPSGAMKGRLDVREVQAPYRVIHYAVQVRRGNSVGPVQLICHRPEPQPFDLVVDHDAGRVGARTHVDFRTELQNAVDVKVTRWVRQLDRTTDSVFQVQKPDTRITFDDLLHGDTVTLAVEAPFALGSGKKAVAKQTFQYKAVPRPELLPTGDEERLDYKPGVELLKPKAYDARLEAAVGAKLDTFTWAREWPRAAANEKADLPAALRRATGLPLQGIEADAAAVAWWLRLVESGQDAKAAVALRREHQVGPTPEQVNATLEAVQRLDGFSLSILQLLGASGAAAELEPDLTKFQDSLDIEPMPGKEVLALDKRVQTALHSAVLSWRRHIDKAGLGWIDGGLIPLHKASDLASLAKMALEDPSAAIGEITGRRAEIAAAIDAPTEAPSDKDARADLLQFHMENTRAALTRLARGIQALGLKCPDRSDVDDLDGLARWTSRVARSMRFVGDKVDAVPLRGPGFFATASAEANDFAKSVTPTLNVWASESVPPAMHAAVHKLLQELGPVQRLAKMDVWAAFLAGSQALMTDLDALAQGSGDAGARARGAVEAFNDAHRSQDPSQLATAVQRYQKVEGEIRSAYQAWENAINRLSATTRQMLGLQDSQQLPDWDVVQEALVDDGQNLQDTTVEALPSLPAGLANSLSRLSGENGRLQRILERARAGGSHEECALVVRDYDRLRLDVAAVLGSDDPHDGIIAAHRQAVVDAAQGVLDARLPEQTALTRTVLNFVNPEGWQDIKALRDALADEDVELDVLSDLTVNVAELDQDPWQESVRVILSRLQAASPEIVQYLRARPAGWDNMLRSEDGVRWVAETVAGLSGVKGTYVDDLRPGTRRLLKHTMQEALLWLA